MDKNCDQHVTNQLLLIKSTDRCYAYLDQKTTSNI